MLSTSHLLLILEGGNSRMDKTVSVRQMIEQKKKTVNLTMLIEKSVPIILFCAAFISVLTTLGIVLTLITETVFIF